MSPPRAFLDACALFPPLVRGLLFSAAAEGLLIPLWSPRVAEEWARAAERDHGPAGGRAARTEAALMRARWPEGEVAPAPPDPDATLLTLPDPDDVHVLEAALAGSAGLLVTFNLRDFPGTKLRALGLAPISPDALLWEFTGRSPDAMSRALAAALSPFPALAADPAEAVRGLKRAQLPRFAKCLKTGTLTL